MHHWEIFVDDRDGTRRRPNNSAATWRKDSRTFAYDWSFGVQVWVTVVE